MRPSRRGAAAARGGAGSHPTIPHEVGDAVAARDSPRAGRYGERPVRRIAPAPWSLSLVSSALLAVASAPSFAQRPPPPLAQLRHENGLRLYSQRRYVEAAHEFEAAYALSPEPELLFNLGRAWEGAGDAARAAEAYARFEAVGAPGADRVELRARIARLRAPVAAPPVVTAAPARVVVAPASPRAPAPAPLPVGPIVLGAVGVAALATMVPLWVSARSTYDDLRATCGDGVCPEALHGDQRRAQSFALAGDVLLGVGVASLAGAATWWLVGRRAPEQRVVAWCGATGCAAAIAGSF